MKQPAIFIGHGSPMNAIEQNQYSLKWKEIGLRFKPKNIMVISAHWLTNETELFQGKVNRTIYDFYGFPRELNQIKYEPPVAKFNKLNFKLNNTWGLDHGAWSVLVHLFPDQKIPVAQLSINKNVNLKEHFELAKGLDKLRNEGTLILFSGNIVHNLRIMDWTGNLIDNDLVKYNNDIKNLVINKSDKLIEYIESSSFTQKAHPTLEHLIPLIYFNSITLLNKESIEMFCDNMEFGSISMSSFLQK